MNDTPPKHLIEQWMRDKGIDITLLDRVHESVCANMTTNDEQAKYIVCDRAEIHGPSNIDPSIMDKPTERAPMLSDASFKAMCDTGDGTVSFETGSKMREVLDFYENLITNGELRVGKKATLVTGNPAEPDDDSWDNVHCSNCLRYYFHGREPMEGEFCRCGSEIVKA